MIERKEEGKERERGRRERERGGERVNIALSDVQIKIFAVT